MTSKFALFYRTQTTGLPLYSEPSEDPRQPHIVQIGAAVVDMEARQIVSSMDLIVQPDGWEIPDEIAKIHGITTERARAVGLAEQAVVDTFLDLWDGRLRIAHNEPFHARIMRIALMRFSTPHVADAWKGESAECTSQLSAPLLVGGSKNPKLPAAHQALVGRPIESSHLVMADVRGCIDVYFATLDASKAAAEVRS